MPHRSCEGRLREAGNRVRLGPVHGRQWHKGMQTHIVGMSSSPSFLLLLFLSSWLLFLQLQLLLLRCPPLVSAIVMAYDC